MDKENTLYPNANILIHGGKIERIFSSGEEISVNAKKTIEGSNLLAMPGLINTHTHAPMTVFRGIADDLFLKDWLYEYIFPLEATYVDARMVEIGAKLAIIEMIKGGTTCFNDMYFFEDQVATVAKQIGIRAVLSESAIDFKAPNSETPEKALAYINFLSDKWKNDSLINIAVGAHAPYSCSAELIKKAKSQAIKLNTLFNIHLAETKWEFDLMQEKYGKTPVEYLYDLGVLDSNTILAHGVHLTDNDIMILKSSGASIAHNPQCNMKLASGIAPVVNLINNSVKVGIGTDGVASNNNLDMFDELNTAALLHKIATGNPTVLDAKTIVRMATMGGAELLGMNDKIGSIEEGKLADIILINLKKPHLVPRYDFFSLLAYSANAADVETTIINGKIVMENRKITYIDEESVINEVLELANRIKREKELGKNS